MSAGRSRRTEQEQEQEQEEDEEGGGGRTELTSEFDRHSCVIFD